MCGLLLGEAEEIKSFVCIQKYIWIFKSDNLKIFNHAFMVAIMFG